MPRRTLLLLPAAAALLAGCGGHRPTATTTATTTSPPKAAGAGNTVWLCFPGKSPDPCASSLGTTVVGADGSRTIEQPRLARDPAIDCFYVYPTISQEERGNADLSIQLPELFVAQAQADRFSQVCKVYAPVYRQITEPGLTDRALHASPLEAYDSVLAAWRDYLAHDNDGRGVVLIGHSQGAYILKHLVQTVIDRSAAERRLLVSAILLGGQVLAANGGKDRGDFAHVPACASAAQTGCVIAYSSFGRRPPQHASFGRDPSPSTHVLCVNPAAPGSTAVTAVTPLFPVALLRFAGARLGVQVGNLRTAWVAYPGLYTAQCRRAGSASWLQVTSTHLPGDRRPVLRPLFGAGFGLHATDVNIALSNLVSVVAAEARAYTRPR